MRLEMVIRIQNEIPDGQSSGLFSNEPFEKKPVKIIEDFVWHSDDYFGSHFLGNWLYTLLTLEKKTEKSVGWVQQIMFEAVANLPRSVRKIHCYDEQTDDRLQRVAFANYVCFQLLLCIAILQFRGPVQFLAVFSVWPYKVWPFVLP